MGNKYIIFFFSLLLLSFFGCGGAGKKEIATEVNSDFFHSGDILFQDSQSSQSLAVKLATRSKWSHCAILMKEDHNWVVFEAVQPVRKISFKEWISLGKNKEFKVKRLRLNHGDINFSCFLDYLNSNLQKNYDAAFSWTEEKMYCSELVWKSFKRCLGIEIGQLQKLAECDLSHPVVRRKLKERYGDSIPLNETIISPEGIWNSSLLETVN